LIQPHPSVHLLSRSPFKGLPEESAVCVCVCVWVCVWVCVGADFFVCVRICVCLYVYFISIMKSRCSERLNLACSCRSGCFPSDAVPGVGPRSVSVPWSFTPISSSVFPLQTIAPTTARQTLT